MQKRCKPIAICSLTVSPHKTVTVKRAMVIFKVLAMCISLVTLHLSVPSSAVEFGQDATGDPNAVHIQGNTSGFLYSERIILTAAHVLNQLRIQPNGDTQGFVYAPGLADKTNAKRYQIIKAIIPKTYVNADHTRNIQPIDDFAIVIVNEDMPLKNRVVIANEQQMRQFAQDKAKVELVGYGLQSGAQRVAPQLSLRAPFKLTTLLYTPEMMNTFYSTKTLNRGDDKPGYWTVVEWGAMHTQATGSVCNGDSGSGFFVEQNDVRYYVGTTGNGVGISNCQADGSIKMDPAGGMSWFPAPYKFLDLIKTAESFVAEEKRKEFAKAEEVRLAAELKAKQEAEVKAKAEEEARVKAEAELKAKQEAEAKAAAEKKKITITCTKGKLAKKITAVNPKCPKGYKRK